MLDTALAQLRFAASMILGVPFAGWSLDWLVDGAVRTRQEFGPLTSEGEDLVRGPTLDDETRRAMQARRFRAQAIRAARETVYYGRRFAELDLDPRRLEFDDIARLPLTPKDALREDPDAFVRRGSRPVLQAKTTGTTGRPTSVHFSAYELRVIVALSTLGHLFDAAIGPDDIVQISTSARAILGNLGLAGASTRIGANVYVAGVIEPERTLALLAEDRHLAGKKSRTSVLSIYPSSVGDLIEAGSRLGYEPRDFGLERILTGGEVVTGGLRQRARRLFGDAVQITESFAMTESIPLGGVPCGQGHLHFEASVGLVEVIDSATGVPALPGQIGTLVITPLPPYRETTLLLCYDTEDLVRAVAEPPTCRLRDLPATGLILGKRRLAVRHASGWTTPRDVLEALESVEAIPLPARCGFWAVPGGVCVEVVARDSAGDVRAHIADSLERQSVPLRSLRIVSRGCELERPFPLRGDLRETAFDRPLVDPLPHLSTGELFG